MTATTHPFRSDSYGRIADAVAGGTGGVAAGIVGGIVLQLVDAGHVLARALPALAGVETPAPAAGWGLFVVMSAGLGLLYAALLSAAGLDVTSLTRGALSGAAYGVVLWLTVAVAVVPLATAAVGYAGAPPFPYVDAVALAGYLGYGVTAGAFHAALAGYRPADTDSGRDVAA